MIAVYRTRFRHHLSVSKVMKTECGHNLIGMDIIKVYTQGIKESEFKGLQSFLPFCKTCLKSHSWHGENWRPESDDET
jgi:hypothetical protein